MTRAEDVWCRFCKKDVREGDTDHEIEDGELVTCNVYGEVAR